MTDIEKSFALTLASDLLYINSKSVTPGDPEDKDPIFVYCTGKYYRRTLEAAAQILEKAAKEGEANGT